jgi:hypothetical protein
MPITWFFALCFVGSVLVGTISSLTSVSVSSIAAGVVALSLCLHHAITKRGTPFTATLVWICVVDSAGWWLGQLLKHLVR